MASNNIGELLFYYVILSRALVFCGEESPLQLSETLTALAYGASVASLRVT
jgi:hypothetical protein